MYSDTVCLFGDKFAPESNGLLTWNEELANGIKVDQKVLAEMAVLAGFLYLKEHGFIDLYLKEGKIVFIITKTATVRRLKDPTSSHGILEDALLRFIPEEESVRTVVKNIIGKKVDNPWKVVLELTKDDLKIRGIIDKEQKGRILFIKRYKDVIKGDIPQEELDQLQAVETALKNFRKDKEFYKKVLSAISAGINAQLDLNEDND